MRQKSGMPKPPAEKVVELVGKCSREIRLELAGPLVEGNTIFDAERPHLIDEPRAVRHHLVADLGRPPRRLDSHELPIVVLPLQFLWV